MKFQRIFYDFEFIEDGTTIDPISLGAVSEDGRREFYALNYDCDYSKASPWVKDNVIAQLPPKPVVQPRHLPGKSPWMHRDQIGPALLKFFDVSKFGDVKLWGYYAAYDHVALAQLWGPMISLPRDVPKYTMDIKQYCVMLGDPRLPEQGPGEHDALADARHNRVRWNFLENYAAGFRESGLGNK